MRLTSTATRRGLTTRSSLSDRSAVGRPASRPISSTGLRPSQVGQPLRRWLAPSQSVRYTNHEANIAWCPTAENQILIRRAHPAASTPSPPQTRRYKPVAASQPDAFLLQLFASIYRTLSRASPCLRRACIDIVGLFRPSHLGEPLPPALSLRSSLRGRGSDTRPAAASLTMIARSI